MHNNTGHRLDVYFDIYINAKPEQVKQALLKWGQKYGLTKLYIKKHFRIEFLWKPVSEYIFDVCYDNDEWILLGNADEKQAYAELLSTLRVVDANVEVCTEWQNLTRVFQLRKEVKNIQQQLKAAENRLEQEESQEPVIHETEDFKKAEKIVNEGTTKEIKAFFQKKRVKLD